MVSELEAKMSTEQISEARKKVDNSDISTGK